MSVLAWSAIPLGTLLGGWVIEATDDVALVYAATGTLNMAELAVRLDGVTAGTRTALFAVLLVAFGIKAAVFPLSMWLPDSYPTAPAPVTAVFAGLLTKVGVYAIIRAHSLLFPAGGLDPVLLVAALMVLPVGSAQRLSRSFAGTLRWAMAKPACRWTSVAT